jgi:hypothetical protein
MISRCLRAFSRASNPCTMNEIAQPDKAKALAPTPFGTRA